MEKLIGELRRRKVLHVAAIYAAVGWLLVQIVATIFPTFGVPAWVVRFAMVLIFAGFPAAMVFSWFYEWSAKGFVETEPASGASPRRRPSRMALPVLAGASALTVFAGAGWWAARNMVPDAANQQIAEAVRINLPSLAVLPFENRSPDLENAFFADGIQDEILARLAKIGSLKVVSRASTRGYGPNPENLPKVGTELGVAHLLQGSVQRSGKLVRVNVQLVEARSQTARWAEVYDRELQDALTVQSQIAGSVARSLNAQLTQAEQSALATAPTTNPAAYDAYLRGRIFQGRAEISEDAYKDAIRLYDEAVRLDPNFALAWAQLSIMHSHLRGMAFDLSPARAKLAEDAAAAAYRLSPELGETFMARGFVRYFGHKDYPAALDLFADASKRLPNDADALMAQSYVLRRQRKFDETLALEAKALQHDPRNVHTLHQYGITLSFFPELLGQARVLGDRALNLQPDDPELLEAQVVILFALGDLPAAVELLDANPPEPHPREWDLFMQQMFRWLYERDAVRAVAALRDAIARVDDGERSTELLGLHVLLAVAQRMAGDLDQAAETCRSGIAAYQRTRQEIDAWPSAALRMAELHAGLGQRREAMVELARGEAATASDLVGGPHALEVRARVEVLLGNFDPALEILSKLVKTPYASEYYLTTLTSAHLRLDPAWDGLRKDPRFAALLASADSESKPAREAPDPSLTSVRSLGNNSVPRSPRAL